MIESSVGWMVVLSLGTVVGLFVTVSMPIIKLTNVLTDITNRLETAEENIQDLSEKNRDSHKRIHERIDNVEKNVNEIRIAIKK